MPDAIFVGEASLLGVTIYEQANFAGRSRTFGVGQHRLFDLSDMNDMTSSIKVPAGFVAYVYEHADSGGGYGISVDLLEDHADLSQLNFNDKISYINVFNTKSTMVVRDHRTDSSTEQLVGVIWVRSSLVNGQFVSGHWERPRASGQPVNNVAVVSPPIPPHDLIQPQVTTGGTSAEPASAKIKNEVIQAFSVFTAQSLWDRAVTHQMGIIGTDFRGIEEIGSAAFERASNNPLIPDFINFWYPQKDKQVRDHRENAVDYYKRTLSGTVVESSISDIEGTYQDRDLDFCIEPAEGYTYLVTNGHPREYTDIMSTQYTGSLHQLGQPDCDDDESIAESKLVEAEIDIDPNVKTQLNTVFNNALGRQLCVYGPWIFDKGHCCHAEIHPAEQIWWSDPALAGRVYFCNLFCDASERFWWRDQMDDGTKLKPWGAPPITGTFAIAFETEVNSPAKQFEIGVSEARNHDTVHEDFERHHLVYQNNTLISVVQDRSGPVKVSFENVGLVGATTVRGFIVIEATVGRCTQIRTEIIVNTGSVPSVIKVPPNSDPNKVPQLVERLAFKKESGHLMLMIAQGKYTETIKTLINLNGSWASGGTPGPVISTAVTSFTVDMSAYHRPSAHGSIVDGSTITITFPDDKTYTGKLQLPNTIVWSNGSAWTKV